MLKNVINEFDAYAMNVISLAKKNLAKSQNTGNLGNSLDYEIIDKKTKNPKLQFYSLPYGKFVDKGVQGADPNKLPSNAKWYGTNKAPMSPYKFGSNSGTGLRDGINKWLTQKGIEGIRDDKGRFLPRKTSIFLISRSIYFSGIRATNFFTQAQAKYNKSIYFKLGKAYANDVKSELKKTQEKELE